MSSAEIMPRKAMRGHTDHVRGVVHLSCGRRIITCSTDGSLRLWDLESGAQIGEDWRDEGVAILSIALSPDGTTISSGNRDSTVSLWDIEKGKVVAKWKGHTQAVRSVCWSPSGERVVSGGWDGTARVWDVKSGHGKPVPGLNPIEMGHRSVLVVSYSPKGTKIATGGDVHEARSGIKIWDASGSKTGQLLYTVGAGTLTVWSLAWTSDEKKLISGFGNGLIRVFNTATWRPVNDYRHGSQLVRAIIVSRNSRLFVSTSSDGTARLWDLGTGRSDYYPPLQHNSDVKCAAFSSDGKLLTTTCADKIAYVWDVQAILKPASLEHPLSIPDVNATGRPAPHRLPGFFDDMQNCGPSSKPDLHRRRSAFAPSWGSRPRALLTRLPRFFRRSQLNADASIELQQCPGPSTSSHHSPPVVEVPALDDKKALYTAQRPERASDMAKRIKNPKWWVRVVLFICCVSPSIDSSH